MGCGGGDPTSKSEHDYGGAKYFCKHWGKEGEPGYCRECTRFIMKDGSWRRDPNQATGGFSPSFKQPKKQPKREDTMSCCDTCTPGPSYPGGSSYNPTASHGPKANPACFGAIGAEASVAAAASATLQLQPTQYSRFKPTVIRGSAVDTAVATAVPNSGGAVTIDDLSVLGQTLIGSADIGFAAIDAYAQRGLQIGGDAPAMTASNTLNCTVTNNHAAAQRIAVFANGRANF